MIQEYVTKLATTVPPSSPPRDKATDSNPLWPKTIKVVAGSEEMFVSPRQMDERTDGLPCTQDESSFTRLQVKLGSPSLAL